MTQKLFSIYDSKGEAYMPLTILPARGLALRSFADECKKADSPFGQHPGDYTLFELGEWDPTSGSVTMYEAKKNLGTGLELREIN